MVINQSVTDRYAIYNADCLEVLPKIPDGSVHLSVYSPPFCGLYNYSSSERDLSNCRSYQEFFEHYGYVVEQIARATMPGRCSAVHCMDVAGKGNGDTARMGIACNLGTGLIDFPGDIIRLHERFGMRYCARYAIWKEPLGVRNRTMAKGLAHKQIVDDSTLCDVASADYLLLFRKPGDNEVPVKPECTRPEWTDWAAPIWTTDQGPFDAIDAGPFAGAWFDVRETNTLNTAVARDSADERHICPLQLDLIERVLRLWSNRGELGLSPFGGIGSEGVVSIQQGRRFVGCELKPSYWRTAVANLRRAENEARAGTLFEVADA